MSDLGQWTTAEPLLRGYPSWIVDENERKRIASYQLYEEMYWGVPNAFKLVQRGEDVNPIYLPAPRSIVETIHRYLASGIQFLPDPMVGTSAEQEQAMLVYGPMFKREKLFSKFNANKREGIFRGDWCWHFYADPLMPDGSRISIQTADPASVFPIYNELNLDQIIGYHIVEQFEFNGKAAIKRLTYRKTTGTGGPSPISVREAIFEVDEWGGPGMSEDAVKLMEETKPEFILPAPIDSLPVYWIQNFQQTGTIYGSSELRGLERIVAAMNQAITDEELALALEGLGVYVSDAGAPIDPVTGEEVPWDLGPGRVVEVPEGTNFSRVNGVSNVTPTLDHIRFLISQLDEASATPAIAKGAVDVQIAESGISLMLQMGPLFARVSEKEQTITDVITTMMYDLRNWIAAYEPSLNSSAIFNTQLIPVYGDKLPVNRKERFTEIMTMVQQGLAPGSWARQELSKLGYKFPDEATITSQILQEKAAMGTVEADPFGDRMNQELG